MLRACPPLLCAQVAATAQGSRKSKAMAAWPGALQTRACPSHAPSSQCSAPWRNASTWGLLLGSGHQVDLRGNTDHSNRLSSSQLPFQSSEYLKAEGLGAPVMLTQAPSKAPALPRPGQRPQRLESLRRAAGGRLPPLLRFYSLYCRVPISACLRQTRLVSIHGSENSGKNKKARPLQGKSIICLWRTNKARGEKRGAGAAFPSLPPFPHLYLLGPWQGG